MVSLSRNFHTNSGGATFFSESVNMGDREQLQPELEAFEGFKKVPTVPLFGAHLICTLILDIVAIVYAVVHPDDAHKCAEYFIIIYIHVALWFITFLLHLATKYVHHQVRLNGYLDFYKKTELHSNLPLLVVSFWTVVLLLVQTLMEHYYPDDFTEKCLKDGAFSPRAYLCALVTVEFCSLLGINLSYMMKVIEFNKQQPPPDILRREWESTGNPETLTSEVGYREMGGKVHEFLEKQADLIRYLKEHNERLNQKVMQLSSRVQGENANNGLDGGTGGTS